MIWRNTTIVLGAGASRPYQFPLGYELADRLRKPISRLPATLQYLLGQMLSEEDYSTFCGRFSKSSAESIDRFIFFNKDLAETARVLVAFELLANKNLAVLPHINRWYSYLFQRMADKCNDAESFARNNVKIITFNYDLSFEWELFRFLEAYFNCSRDLAIEVAKAIRVHHVHGSVGLRPWECDEHYDYFVEPDQNQLKQWSKEIRFVRDLEDDNSDYLNSLRREVALSKNIFFLGFGFHEDNLDKLFHPVGHGVDRYNITRQSRIVASTMGQASGEVRHWRGLFSNVDKISTFDADCLDTLRESKDILLFSTAED